MTQISASPRSKAYLLLGLIPESLYAYLEHTSADLKRTHSPSWSIDSSVHSAPEACWNLLLINGHLSNSWAPWSTLLSQELETS
jgi:hypothetical protein